MKILGCFKIVPDLDQVAPEDWTADEQLEVDTGYVKLLWNCFDEGALEMMLKLSDLSESFAVVYELNALTIGKAQHDPFLKTLYALGYKHAARVEIEEPVSFCPEMIATVIANYVRDHEAQDIVVMGSQSSDGSNTKTPLLLAEKLCWPCITQVTELVPVDEGHIIVKSRADGMLLTQTVKVPCVLAVGNAASSYLRVPTLKAKMRLGRQPIEYLKPEQLSMTCSEPECELVALGAVNKDRDTVMITGDTPKEKAEKLYYGYLKERLKKI